jgi:ATP-dependent RNA helicase DDX27
MRKAEMEIQKGENLLKHEEEIFSRPARTWFQSSKEKAKSQGMVNFYRTVVFLTTTQKQVGSSTKKGSEKARGLNPRQKPLPRSVLSILDLAGV